MATRERWDPRQHPRDSKGRFVRKRTPLPVGGKKANLTKSYGIGKPKWPAEATLDVGPGSGRPGATVGARVRYRDAKRDVAVGSIADNAAFKKQAARAAGRASQMKKRAEKVQRRPK